MTRHRYVVAIVGALVGAAAGGALGALAGTGYAELANLAELEALGPYIIGVPAGLWVGGSAGCWTALRLFRAGAEARTFGILVFLLPALMLVAFLVPYTVNVPGWVSIAASVAAVVASAAIARAAALRFPGRAPGAAAMRPGPSRSS